MPPETDRARHEEPLACFSSAIAQGSRKLTDHIAQGEHHQHIAGVWAENASAGKAAEDNQDEHAESKSNDQAIGLNFSCKLVYSDIEQVELVEHPDREGCRKQGNRPKQALRYQLVDNHDLG